jgi:hypothetical protein
MHDRTMDARLRALRPRYDNRVCLRSCDTDRGENQPFVQGIANIPALACFLNGHWYESRAGLRSDADLRRLFDAWIAAADVPPDRRSPRVTAAGPMNVVRRLLGRKPKH